MEEAPGFEDFEQKFDALREEVRERGEQLCRIELHKIAEILPDHQVVFYTGMYAPYIKVDPPIEGRSKIDEYDIGEDRHKLDSGIEIYANLKEHLHAMSRIAVFIEDTYGVDMGIVDLPAEHGNDDDMESSSATFR